ncbi:hypothetical protein ACFC06_13225 [Nocardia sp. NPDC056064]|uniref:hypothetical protein n=1 Tax=Nocardia sp. NPDC056064 TaxID=3345701 RepID=UPI0035D68742
MSPEPVESPDQKSLREKIVLIREKKDQIKDLPDDVQTWCGHLVKLVRTNGYSGVALGNVWSAFSTENVVDAIWNERDKINAALGDSWTELSKIDPDLGAPIEFITVANEWRNLKTAVQLAESDVGFTKLSGTWHGDAATRYGVMRNEQNIPLETLPLVFEDIAVSLETVAKAELALYSELATKVAELEQSVVAAVGDMSDLLDPAASAANLANTVEAAKVFIVNTITAMAESDATNIIESQKIQQNGGYQRGIPNNKWPAAVSETAAYGHGLDGLKNSMGDGTTADGDKSDWELGPAVTVAQ